MRAMRTFLQIVAAGSGIRIKKATDRMVGGLVRPVSAGISYQ